MLRTLFVIAVLIGSALSAFDYSECGRQRDDLDPEIKIVGGKPAQDGAWPWQAALYQYGRRICGATVVHPEWIVTAAHCVDVINDPPIFEYLVGSNTILNYNQSEYYQFRQTTAVYVHPNYRLESSDYDIALMRMSEPFEWDDAGYVYPACVPSGDMVDDFPPGHPSVITGWGAETEGGSQSNDLNEVEVPIVDQTSCNESYSGSISDYMICAGIPEGGKDSCQGYSGGPMVALHDEQWYLIGVVSWGTGCARPGYPGVFARVTSFSDWIEPIFSGGEPDGMPVGQCGDDDFQCGGGFCVPKDWRCDGYRDCYQSTDENYCESALKPFDVYLDKRIDPTSTGLDNFNASESNGCGFECLETDCHAFDVMPDLNENNETVCILAMTGAYMTIDLALNESRELGITHFRRGPIIEPGSELTSALGTIVSPAYTAGEVNASAGAIRYSLDVNGDYYNHLTFNFISIKGHDAGDTSTCDDYSKQNLVVIQAMNSDMAYINCLSDIVVDTNIEIDSEDAILELYSHEPNDYGFVVDYRASWFCDSMETGAPGYLVSPKYGIAEYPGNVMCRSMIHAPMGHRVYLEVEFFRIEFDGDEEGSCDSNWDTLEIFDGHDQNAESLGRYCGDQIPEWLMSTSDVLYVVFQSDSSAQETGYKLNYYFIAETNMTVSPSMPHDTPPATTEEPSSSRDPERVEAERQIQDLEDELKSYKVGISAVIILGTILVGVLIAAIVTISRRETKLREKMGVDGSDGSVDMAHTAAYDNNYKSDDP
ncbi:uncharacterized protein [Apostichopus japonicus]|uniref:uncharacterized protein n=1 Tax=Stichopus japonicus TaxID=307972 RepID=UPI003AB399E8